MTQSGRLTRLGETEKRTCRRQSGKSASFFAGLLVANLLAHRVFLLIKRFLLRGRYMTVIELRH